MFGLFFDSPIILPDASSVSVAKPNETVNSYVFNKFSVNRMVFVASPIATGSKPVASGSKVPPCPTFLTPNFFLIIFTISVEPIPLGLSTTSHPFIKGDFIF